MARTPHKPAQILPEPSTVAEAHALTLAEDTQAQDIERDMEHLAMRSLGRLEALEFSETVAARARVEVFLELKRSKAYRAIEYRDADGNRKRISDLDEFCERYLGKSSRRLRQMAEDYHLLGGDLYEAAERIGFRNQDYRALKALPAEDQEVIKQAMQSDDRGQVIDLLQEMAARHASEKEALIAEATEAKETAAARDDVIRRKETKISELEVRAASAERRQADFSDIEKRDYECAPLHETVRDAMLALAKMEREVARLTQEVGGELVQEECFHAVLLATKRALEINDKYRLGIDVESLDIDTGEFELRTAGLNPEAMQ